MLGITIFTDSGSDSAVFHYRCASFRDQLNYLGVPSIVWTPLEAGCRLPEVQGRVVILNRIAWSQQREPLFDFLQKNALALGYDTDDLLISEDICKVIELCSFIVVSTPNLAREYQKKYPSKRIFVRRNVVPALIESNVIKSRLPSVGGFRIGVLAGSDTHSENLDLIKGTLVNLRNLSDKFTLTTIGIRDSWISGLPENTISQEFSWIPFPIYPLLIPLQCDLILVPLLNTTFNQCKSAVKWLESSITGVVCLASPVGQFKDVIIDGVDGFLVEDGDWEKKVLEVINGHTIHRVGEAAKAKVLDKFTTRNVEDASKVLAWLQQKY